jgi:hypothetical protein
MSVAAEAGNLELFREEEEEGALAQYAEVHTRGRVQEEEKML